MTDEDAKGYADDMTDLERSVMMLCARSQTYNYRGIAERTGAPYDEIKRIGDHLQAMNLAHISPVSMAGRFSGSGILLNPRGEQVKQVIEKRRPRKLHK